MIWLAWLAFAGVEGAVDRARPSVVHVAASTQAWDGRLAAWLTSMGELPVRGGAATRATAGAGFVLAPGEVATTLHTVAGARKVEVRSASGATLPASVVRVAVDRDLAILSVPGLDAPPVTLADPPRPGGGVVTLGFPTDQGLVVSAGVVSGVVDRVVGASTRRTWLLTDAMVRVGHSGGPLVDEAGMVVGMVVGGYATGTSAEGLGLVLPASALGVDAAPAPPAGIVVGDAPDLTLGGSTFADDPRGVRVLAASPEAAALGLAAGMVIDRAAGSPVKSTADLRALRGSVVLHDVSGDFVVFRAAL